MVTAEVNSSFPNFLNAFEMNADPLSGIISSANRDMEKHWSEPLSSKRGCHCKACLEKVAKIRKILFIAE